ncbi:hypothetical protein P8C59_005075 [Phyllachora maydis]|uniref:SAM-dependent MTase RsmB/NOP-type domain-containing protein n=1 Tax=Phyllachora maydis TaxID=1825666 RepID=A0AAD9MF51_9PEZI|nr:hypothetical protein P8C59_005075 [Phyllachora maydis]
MSLYHETAAVLTTAAANGGGLKSHIFANKQLTSPATQADLLRHERKLSPTLALLLVHDFLLSKHGIALPRTHGLRASVEGHKARLASELTRARLRRRCATAAELKVMVEAEARTRPVYPRWVRINGLRTTVQQQLDTTLSQFAPSPGLESILDGEPDSYYVDKHVPNLLAVSPGRDLTKTEAYRSGAIILQDKASCFPAYLLDPGPEDGHVIDACAAPGNKTSHAADIMASRSAGGQKLHAFERDPGRAETLELMVKRAGAHGFTVIHKGQDFTKVDPTSAEYSKVGALLLDPSCSGSGMVGRDDDMPKLHLPTAPRADTSGRDGTKGRKRKRACSQGKEAAAPAVLVVDDEGKTTVLASERDLESRIEGLATFQLAMILHAFRFPAARKVTYSTCSVYAGENEQVVLKALSSDVAKERGWRILGRDRQVRGMREWPVRGAVTACDGDDEMADACIRANRDDGQGLMGFFVAAFVRDEVGGGPRYDGSAEDAEDARVRDDGREEAPFLRDASSRTLRDPDGMPTFPAGIRRPNQDPASKTDAH